MWTAMFRDFLFYSEILMCNLKMTLNGAKSAMEIREGGSSEQEITTLSNWLHRDY